MLIDVDCGDPPEVILEFVEKHEQAFDIVYGERVDREESATMKSALNLLTGRTNSLTRFLMGLDAFGPAVLISILVAAALSPVAMLLSVTNWLAKRGV